MSYEVTGGLANQTLYSASKAKEGTYIPLKSSDERMQDVTKYGGFTSVSTAYFMLVEHDGKRENVFEQLKVYRLCGKNA